MRRPRRRWRVHAEPTEDTEFAKIMAYIYNEKQPLRYLVPVNRDQVR